MRESGGARRGEELRLHRARREAAGAAEHPGSPEELEDDALDRLILRSLAAGPMRGRDVAARIREVSDDTLRVRGDRLYPALRRLMREGAVSASWEGEGPGRARRYTLTRAGRRRLYPSAPREPERSRWPRGWFSRRVADAVAPALDLPGENTLARLQAAEGARGESYWGTAPVPGLAHRVLEAMRSRVTHGAVRPADAEFASPPARHAVAPLTETSSGRWAARGILLALALALACGAWIKPWLTLASIVTLVVAYLAWDALLSFAIWVQINSRSPPPGWPAERRRSLTPWVLRPRHAALFFVHKLNYLLHMGRALVYLLFLRGRWVRRASEDELEDRCVEILIGTSYAIFLAQRPEHEGSSVFVLELEKQAISQELGRFDNRLRVVLDAAARRILRFEWNGAEVTRRSLRLQLLCDVGSQSIHPIIHSFNTRLYEQVDQVDRAYDRLFRHGQNLNAAAHHYPALCLLCPPRWFKVVLETNASVPIPPHAVSTLRRLAPHSPYVRFMLAARGAYLRLVAAHGVGVDAEALFICSALHSVDHAVYGALQDRVDFPGAGNNLVYRWFHLPVSVRLFMDNSLRGNRHETAFYGDLYAELSAIDRDYADMIELSISS
ncbi:MAG: helix-turn-helix transcriptional regulator [Myxococcales bacterium]|nr:helix-turn-helix transcriptional regulator [Myxococcales bacterium]